MNYSTHEILSKLDSVAGGLARIRGINDTVAEVRDDMALQFDEWDWEIGVGVYGLYRQALTTDNRRLITALVNWYDWQIGRGLPARQVNSTAPMLALSFLIDHVDRPDWNDLVRDWADWLMNGLKRTEDDGFQHVVKELDRPNTGELWDDTLFMTCLFLARAGIRFARPDWVDEALYQFMVHSRYLSDPVTGLWYHGWTFEGRHNFAKAFWARGNSWITIAIPELFSIVDDIPPATRRLLQNIFKAQVSSLAKLQTKDGFFTTLLDDPASPIEASGTAGIAYGVARGIELGMLPAEFSTVAEKAYRAVCSCIEGDGIVSHVSDGTPMGHTLQFYRDIPDIPTPYGQALTMLMLAQSLGGASQQPLSANA